MSSIASFPRTIHTAAMINLHQHASCRWFFMPFICSSVSLPVFQSYEIFLMLNCTHVVFLLHVCGSFAMLRRRSQDKFEFSLSCELRHERRAYPARFADALSREGCECAQCERSWCAAEDCDRRWRRELGLHAYRDDATASSHCSSIAAPRFLLTSNPTAVHQGLVRLFVMLIAQ
jgi:hypothetical protein